MSLVGTRPPTLDEWEKYEPHHRARMSFRPGLTGLWQVSGRSNITDFEEVVKLDTHEQPFNRLIQKIDELKKDGIINEDVIIQTGFSTYEPKYCQWSKLIPYQQMVKNVADARIVITHGGPASFIMPLQIGKRK